ncbi:MAG: hypothetical protein ABSB35_28960 [Bryobacteraceae bacterium]|jgi:hypothetical protein
MSDPTDFIPDDVLGFEFDSDPVTGEKTGVLTVTFKDGTDRKLEGSEVDKVRRLLQDYSAPSA